MNSRNVFIAWVLGLAEGEPISMPTLAKEGFGGLQPVANWTLRAVNPKADAVGCSTMGAVPKWVPTGCR